MNCQNDNKAGQIMGIFLILTNQIQ